MLAFVVINNDFVKGRKERIVLVKINSKVAEHPALERRISRKLSLFITERLPSNRKSRREYKDALKQLFPIFRPYVFKGCFLSKNWACMKNGKMCNFVDVIGYILLLVVKN